MNKYFRTGLGLVVSGFFLWLAFRNIDRVALFDALIHVRVKWMVVGLIVYLLTHVLRAFRWSLLVTPLAKTATPVSMFPFVMFGFLVNILLPGRIGEVAKSMAVAKRFSIPTAEVLGTVAVERLGDLVGLLATLLFAIRVFPPARKAFPIVIGSLLGGIVFLIAAFYLVKKLEHLIKQGSLLDRALRWVEKVYVGVKAVGSIKIALGVALLSVGVWYVEAATLMLTGRAFGLGLSPYEAMATLTGISLGVIIPASPGFVGTFEYFGKEALRILGYAPNAALVFIGFHHVFQMIVCALLGLPVLFEMGMMRPPIADKKS
jgi:uncharacterized protein (TIRG00374 family)